MSHHTIEELQKSPIGWMGGLPVSVINSKAATDAERSKFLPIDQNPRPPVVMPKISPQSFIAEIRSERARSEKSFFVAEAYLWEGKHFSSTPISDLKPIRLQEMMLNKRHSGGYLLCRIIAPPYSTMATMVGVEDTEGWSQLVEIFNFPHTEKMKSHELDTLFPLNTVLAIREPYAKQAPDSNECSIIVHSPSDIIFLEPGDPIIGGLSWNSGVRPFPQMARTDKEWKELGNSHFKAKEYFAAAVAFTFGLRRDPSFTVLHLNRSLAYLRLGNYEYALADCREVLKVDDITKEMKFKALYRAGQATYGQGDYSGAKEWYEQCLTEESVFKEAGESIKRCDQRIKEKETGDYDWVSLWKLGSDGSRLDLADYVGPIEVAFGVGPGLRRGVIATRDIKMGELILVSKAVASTSLLDYPKTPVHPTVNSITDKQIAGLYYQVTQQVISKIYASPTLASNILYLYDVGPSSKDSAVRPHATTPGSHSNPLDFSFDIDVGRIEKILMHKSSVVGDPEIRLEKIMMQQGDTEATNVFLTAVHILPSIFNHRCLPNAGHTRYGDIMVLRAIEDIPKGEEITTNKRCHPSYNTRMSLMSAISEKCDCALCVADQADGPDKNAKRDELIKAAEDKEMSVSAARELVKEMEKTYSKPRDVPSPCLTFAYGTLLEALAIESPGKKKSHDTVKEMIRLGMSQLEMGGVSVIDTGLEVLPEQNEEKLTMPIAKSFMTGDCVIGSRICVIIAAIFFSLGNHRRAKRWLLGSIFTESVVCGRGITAYRSRNKELLGPLERLLDDIEVLQERGKGE